ncbi:MAG TPA: FtsX-like permease family protein [Chryseosolibacter sp.]|nr:FtsX-like permease family protein [Chryseosolibacter sp.]
MLKNYLLISLRNLRQSPLYAFINVFSLAIGVGACIIIYLFITDERSFDDFHAQKRDMYRLDEVQNFTGTNLQKVALSMPGMGPALAAEFPEVRSYARFWGIGKQLVERNDTRVLIDQLARVDSTFLDLFDYGIMIGDRATALDEPNTIAVTATTAKKFFKNEAEALGGMLQIGTRVFKVTAILNDVPENSHLQFDALISMATVTSEDKTFNDRWGSNFLNTYLLMQPDTDIKAFEKKLPAFMSRHMDNPDINKYYVLFLQPLEAVHLGSTEIEHDYNNYRKFNGKYLDVFAIVGGFILLIASVNFMNLTTARSSHRWKEIGVRKTVGARKFQLFGQFIFESVLLSLLALALAFVIDLIFLPLLNSLIGRTLSLTGLLNDPGTIVIVLGVVIVLGILTGIYPSFYMTSFNMARVLKGGGKGEGRSLFRSGLVVVQFGLAIAMIVSTFIVLQQLSFMKNTDVGFEKDQMMLIDLNRESNQKFETIKNELLKSKLIAGVTASGQRLGNNFHQWGFKAKTDTGVFTISPSNVNVEYDFLKVYGIKIKEGRDFSKAHPRDNGFSFIVNESLAKELGLKETIGSQVGHGWYHDDSLGTIIAVTENFNFNSLHHKINTLSMVVHPDWGYDEMTVKIAAGNTSEAIEYIKKVWEANVESYPFSYSFLDEHFEVLYRSDEQLSAVVTVMAGLAILISCLGLFGLAAITTQRKTKEIGIRKALGATETEITFLLSKNFSMLVIIAFILSSPATYLLLRSWLDSFAYRIDINLLVFVTGGAVALVIALVTICYHTIRSARANPVSALRYE